jgi:pimeloyl-ACP methyl ester carboxylesterase
MIRTALASTLALCCLSTATPALAEDTPTLPIVSDPIYMKPVRLVDVDHGRRINLYCTGSGSPAVIFDSGLNDSTIAWAFVQPAISKTNMACSYDRAGLGNSDPQTRPGTASNDVDDIHKALQIVGVKPPYILVGHSAGGMAVRLFADRYRDEVVGMVIVDGSHEDQSARSKALATPEQQAHWDDELADRTCLDAIKHGEIPKDSPVYAQCAGEPDPRKSKAINDFEIGYAAKKKYQEAVFSERQNFYGLSGDQVRATRHDFGDMPIVVLTRGPQPVPKGSTQADQDKRFMLWIQMHNEVAAMSTRGVNEIVPRSGHIIAYDRPEIVIDAIHQVTAIAAEQAGESSAQATK